MGLSVQDERIGKRGAMDVVWYSGQVTRCEGRITGIVGDDVYMVLDTWGDVVGDVESLEVLG